MAADETIGDPETARAACGCAESEWIGRIVAGSDDDLPMASMAVCARGLHQSAATRWVTRLTGHPTARLIREVPSDDRWRCGPMTDDLTYCDPEDLSHELRLHAGWPTALAMQKMMRQAADEIDRLRAQAPPTAGEVLAHLERDGVVERWSCSSQSWETLLGWSAQLVGLRRANPSTPQPGLRLDQGVTDG